VFAEITSLNSIKQLISVVVKSCVFFEVRTGYLNISLMNCGSKGLIILAIKEAGYGDR
jgi:hypothetical protein